jgi:hypothetical protein
MNLATAQVALKWLAVLSYAAVLLRLVRYRLIWRFPAFSLYLLLMAIYLPLWNPWAVEHSIVWQAVLMLAMYAVCLEALWLATETVSTKERAFAFALVTVEGYVVMSGGFGLHPGNSFLDWYRAIRQHSAMFMAWSCCGAALLFWRWTPPRLDPQVRNHGLILCCYTATYAVRALFPPRGSMRMWLIEGCVSFGLQIVWLGLWGWNIRPCAAQSYSRTIPSCLLPKSQSEPIQN